MVSNSPRITLITALTGFDGRNPKGTDEKEPATGVLTLASIIRDRFATTVIDLNDIWRRAEANLDDFVRLASTAIADTGADVLGFSSICSSYPMTIRLTGLAARELPESYIVLGGPQASVVDVATMEAFRHIDAVVRGEAEETFPALLHTLCEQQLPTAVPGVTFRQGGSIQRNPNASVILDLDAQPLPAFDLHPGVAALKTFPLEIGRGCPFACTFCSTNDFFRRRFRLKSAERTLEQMRTLHKRYSITKFDLIHDMFTVDRAKVVEFCELLIRNGSPFEWGCSARTDCVDSELLEMMKAAGCGGIFFGIETGSPRLQILIDKGLNLDESRRVLREADRVGIKTTASLIAGYPQETLEDFRQTLEFFADAVSLLWLDPQLHVLSPLAETPLTTQYRDRLFLDDNWFQRSEGGLQQDALARELIAAHPDIFPNFYAFPCEIDRGFLQETREFLVYLSLRCDGLFQALRVIEGNVLSLVERWYRDKGVHSPGYYYGWEFLQDLLSFADREYGAYEDVAVTVTSRFYRALAESAAKRRDLTVDAEDDILSLDPEVYIVTVEGDIIHVLECLRAGIRPPASSLNRTVTVVVQEGTKFRSQIFELPPISNAILRHAEKQSSMTEIISDLEEQEFHVGSFDIEDVVLTAVDLFEREGLVHRSGLTA